MARDLKKARQNLERVRELAYDAFNRVEERGSLVSEPLKKLAMQTDEALAHLDRVMVSIKKGVL